MIRLYEARLPLFLLSLSCVLGWFIHPYVCLVLASLIIFTLFFFRDPERPCEHVEGELLCPADGRILEIEREDDMIIGKSLRIAIFMSITDVHVNRCPHSGKVISMRHRAGKKVRAYLKGSVDARECNRIDIDAGFRYSVVQYAGILARRIVPFIDIGENIVTGQRIGMIMYGSRVDLIMPEEFKTELREGERVFAGITQMAKRDGRN